MSLYRYIELDLPRRKVKLPLQPMLEGAEHEVINRDAAKGERTYYGFGPIGSEIQHYDHRQHHQEG